jgi:hypothetical protein
MKTENLGYIILAIVLIALSIWWTFAQWNECKKMELSNFYCIQHIFK